MARILIVDDEPQIVDLLAEFLARNGFEVLTATGGAQALDLLNKEALIDVIILDIRMPKVSGYQVIDQMRQDGRTIPVIIFTGSLEVQDDLPDLEKKGFTREDILFKPVDLLRVLEMIRAKIGH